MATATQQGRNGTTVTADREQLEEVIRETEARRKTIVGEAAKILMVPPSRVCELLRNVWRPSKGQPPLEDAEMFAGLSLISRYELDPIAKEVYVTRDGQGRLLTIIGIDGWIKILDRTDHYDGFEQEVHEEKGHVTWIETKIYSTKRSHPAVYRAFAHEYAAIAGILKDKIPIHMLGIFSLRHAARRFVPIGGHVVTEEEAEFMGAGMWQPQQDATPPKTGSKADQLADALVGQMQKTKIEQPSETHMVGGPPYKELFRQYAAELNTCKTAEECRAVYDKWAGPDSEFDWPADLASAMCAARDDQMIGLQKPAARKAAGKRQLFDGHAGAVEAGH